MLRNNRSGTVDRFAVAFFFLAAGGLLAARDVSAQQGTFTFGIMSAGPQLNKVPAMISILRDGAVVAQNEVVLGFSSSTGWFSPKLPVGVYDVRVEAEGLVTEAKRGVRILDGEAVNIAFMVRPGTGVHVIEYAIGGLAREEVATRLSALETSVAKLQPTTARAAVNVADQIAWGEACCPITAIDKTTGIITATDAATKRSVQFRVSAFEPINGARLPASVRVGQKVWVNYPTQKVSVDGADPCCVIVPNPLRE